MTWGIKVLQLESKTHLIVTMKFTLLAHTDALTLYFTFIMLTRSQ